jgi:hypothetical protein
LPTTSNAEYWTSPFATRMLLFDSPGLKRQPMTGSLMKNFGLLNVTKSK